MSHQLQYHRPEEEPKERFYWRDTIWSAWLQVIGLVVCVLAKERALLVIWVLSVSGYWIGATVAAVRGNRPSFLGFEQVFVRWGFPMMYMVILAFTWGLAIIFRW